MREPTARPGKYGRLDRTSALVFLALICAHASAFAKREDDVVVFKNGDRMTGEIKSLTQGELSFKADYMSAAVRLDWKKVARLESKDHYIIALTSGVLYTGSLSLTSSGGDVSDNFVIQAGNAMVRVKQDEVRRLQPAEARPRLTQREMILASARRSAGSSNEL